MSIFKAKKQIVEKIGEGTNAEAKQVANAENEDGGKFAFLKVFFTKYPIR